VMKASRSEAAREAVRADESNLPHARLQGQALSTGSTVPPTAIESC